MASPQELSCGRDFHTLKNVVTVLDSSRADGYRFIVIPLVHPRFERSGGVADHREGLFTTSDLVLSSSEWSRLVVGKVSDYAILDLAIDTRRQAAVKALKQELAWAAHISLPAIQLPICDPKCIPFLANIINGVVRSTSSSIFWIQVPMTSTSTEESTPAEDPWEWWITLKQLCVPTARLAVALELTDSQLTAEQILRWVGEPLKMVIVPTSIFVPNPKGFPVLKKMHQIIVKQLLKLEPQFAVKGNAGPHGDKVYLGYLKHMYKTRPEKGPVETFAHGYEDYLQAPLQPLMDNLESQTYETFEKDPFKYAEYQRAVCAALRDRVPESQRKTKVSTVMVVGAGRGPLVQCCLKAAEEAGCKVRVFAIEKNPNAIVTLEGRNSTEWNNQVTVVSTDMRDWITSERADIMVSELLGSFADNELSPECLDGASKFLAGDGISIPATETSFMTPVSTVKLHTELVNSKDTKQLQTPFVVLLHNAYNLAPVQRVFDFVHPNPERFRPEGPDNTRYKCLTFTSKQSSMMHGFAGYFESILYKEFMLSINPETHSPGMFSWFPIYFPILSPIYVSAGQTVEVHIWRKATDKKVWYEWAVTKPVVSPIHNVEGSSYYIGL